MEKQLPVCKLCLFKIEVGSEGEAQLETAIDLTEIITEIFQDRVRFNLTSICTWLVKILIHFRFHWIHMS